MTVSRACHLLGISRQAWYQAQRAEHAREAREQRVVDFVRAIRRCQPRIGARKLHHLLHEQPDRALHLGRDHLFLLLRARRLLVPRRRAYHKTTHSHHRFRRHPNLLKPGPEQVVASRPNQVWVADITYLPTRSGMSYVSLVTDAYSRKIVGHHVHESLRSEDVEQALRKALRERPGSLPLIHHSDSKNVLASVSMWSDSHSDRPMMDDLVVERLGWPDPHSDRPLCLSLDLSTIREHCTSR